MPAAFPNLYNIIFKLLKVTPTGNFQDDFLRLILLPHVVIIIWLYLIARGPLFMKMHKGIGTLLAVAIYVFIVWYGWYPMISSLSMLWLVITIIISFFYFMLPKFVHPSATAERMGLGKAIGALGQRREIDKAVRLLQADLARVRRTQAEAKAEANELGRVAPGSPAHAAAIQTVQAADAEVRALESKIAELQRSKEWGWGIH